MFRENKKASFLCRNYIFGAETDQDSLLPLILPYGEVALNYLLNDLCIKATNTKQSLPTNPRHEALKESGNPDLVKIAIENEINYLAAVAYDEIHPYAEAVAKAVRPLYDKAKRDKNLLKGLKSEFENFLSDLDSTSWAAALVLLEVADELGDDAVEWIQAGLDKTGLNRTSNPKDLTLQEFTYYLVYQMVNARAGDETGQGVVERIAKANMVSQEEFEKNTTVVAYACFSLSD